MDLYLETRTCKSNFTDLVQTLKSFDIIYSKDVIYVDELNMQYTLENYKKYYITAKLNKLFEKLNYDFDDMEVIFQLVETYFKYLFFDDCYYADYKIDISLTNKDTLIIAIAYTIDN